MTEKTDLAERRRDTEDEENDKEYFSLRDPASLRVTKLLFTVIFPWITPPRQNYHQPC